MKIVVLIVRLLLGLVFFVFGLTPFCNSSRALYPAAWPDSFFRLYFSRIMYWRSAPCRRLAAYSLVANFPNVTGSGLLVTRPKLRRVLEQRR